MARVARFKVSERDAWYHLHSRIAGKEGEYGLSEAVPRRVLIDLIRHFSAIYFCEAAAFSVMGNHYHLVLRFDKPRQVSRSVLRERSKLMYPGTKVQAEIEEWTDEQWEHYCRRLFDVSEYMRNIQAAFARWYNRSYKRRGRFWADRFKSVYLAHEQAVLDCMLYVELNPVRAGLVERPEEWKGSSIYLRELGKDGWLTPLSRFMKSNRRKAALRDYRERLYYRGNVPSKPGQAAISRELLDEEIARGFTTSGLYRKRLGYWVDGIAVGSEDFIRAQISRMREEGQYLRRKHPISQLGGIHMSLREQRSTSVVF